VGKPEAKPRRTRKKKPAEPTGLLPAETAAKPPKAVEEICEGIEADGGKCLAPYREPLGGHWVLFAALPIDQVEPTSYQRGLSESHVKRLTDVIRKTDRYLDPVIAFRVGEKRYVTPNGNHRLHALKTIGARCITALVVTEQEVARLILALNCEKAHNLREKCLEVIKLAQDLQSLPGMKETDFSLEFEDPAFLTLGLCYLDRPRFAGSAYHPLLKRADVFIEKPLSKSLVERTEHKQTLLEIDDRVSDAVAALKAKGFESPYLKSFVVARCNPLRFLKGDAPSLEESLRRMLDAARKFDAGKIKVTDVARSGGAPVDEG